MAKASSPSCPNCGKSEIVCDADLYLDQVACCSSCEHTPEFLRPKDRQSILKEKP